MRGITEGFKKINGLTLKVIACVVMLLDHLTAGMMLPAIRAGLYPDSISFETIVDDYLYGKDFYDNNSTFKDKLFDYVGDKYSTYKHTFKINYYGSYTWVSTKIVNEK